MVKILLGDVWSCKLHPQRKQQPVSNHKQGGEGLSNFPRPLFRSFSLLC